MKHTHLGLILSVLLLKSIHLKCAPMFDLARGVQAINEVSEIAKSGGTGASAVRDANELRTSFSAAGSTARGTEIFKPTSAAPSLTKSKSLPGMSFFLLSYLQSAFATGAMGLTFLSIFLFGFGIDVQIAALKTDTSLPSLRAKGTSLEQNSLSLDTAPNAVKTQEFNPQKALESTKPGEIPKEAPKPGTETFDPKNIDAPKPNELPKEAPNPGAEISDAKNLEEPKPGDVPTDPPHTIPARDAPLPPTELPIRPLSSYPWHFRMKEWFRQATTNKMLVHLATHGDEGVKEWAEANEFVQLALKWEKQETWVGSKLSKLIPAYWRQKFTPSVEPGRIGKAWRKMFGSNHELRKSWEGWLKAPLLPFVALAKGVQKLRSSYNLKFARWLRLNAPENIRATIPARFKFEDDAEKAALAAKEARAGSKVHPLPSTAPPDHLETFTTPPLHPEAPNPPTTGGLPPLHIEAPNPPTTSEFSPIHPEVPNPPTSNGLSLRGTGTASPANPASFAELEHSHKVNP
ncbi:hypothetical protein PSTG_11943 [Puccinia striiformis f. sp. tritici PST-78]|uniref:Uncharacterized protein n=1 Tax=Puccinia striiformis f. sp. tritici PST-78 TaxID=1165861 RepID=A0A0L0V652_9BASI|nr:hypothetical protein PSTG_11943 [Puccinia striiformis f. sp. tritici PST-78]